MLATLGRNSEIYRIMWPHIDNYQHLQTSFAGVHLHGSTMWLVDSGRWHCTQSYVQDSNIVNTILTNDENQLEVTVTDFVEPERDVLVRHFRILNRSGNSYPIRFLYYASFHFQNNPRGNGVIYSESQDALIHYRQGFHFAVGGTLPNDGYQAGGGALENGNNGYLPGAGVNLSGEGSQVWDLGVLDSQAQKEITVFKCPAYSLSEAGEKLAWARQKGYGGLLESTSLYWKEFLAKAHPISSANQEVINSYKRSLLVGGLLCDRETGGIIAAPEIDEKYVKSGGYGYCWPRDCVFVADAMARAGYRDIAQRFYLWSMKSQLPDGSWFQRYDTQGNLAPGWGSQVDQSGSVLWGIWQYDLLYNDNEFLHRIWPTLQKGAEYLEAFIDVETGLTLPSFDLWEERVGEHAYSAAAVYGGLSGAANVARKLGYNQEADRWQQIAAKMAAGITTHLWNEEKQCFIRTIKKVVDRGEYEFNKNQGAQVWHYKREKDYDVFQIWRDDLMDASLLGLVHPFEVIPATDSRMTATVDWIESTLTNSRTGGIKRYEYDHYIGGNPWINTTLWMALYFTRAGQYDRANSLIHWVVDHRTDIGLLPEQVDQNTGEPAWIIPLTWSHAMFILAVLELANTGRL